MRMWGRRLRGIGRWECVSVLCRSLPFGPLQKRRKYWSCTLVHCIVFSPIYLAPKPFMFLAGNVCIPETSDIPGVNACGHDKFTCYCGASDWLVQVLLDLPWFLWFTYLTSFDNRVIGENQKSCSACPDPCGDWNMLNIYFLKPRLMVFFCLSQCLVFHVATKPCGEQADARNICVPLTQPAAETFSMNG
jgi:hypothetical protein